MQTVDLTQAVTPRFAAFWQQSIKDVARWIHERPESEGSTLSECGEAAKWLVAGEFIKEAAAQYAAKGTDYLTATKLAFGQWAAIIDECVKQNAK